MAVWACNDHQQMLSQLEELERQNLADSLMTNDSLAVNLCDYFDNHGTPNERMRAHYMLARTYTDREEAPQALEEFMKSIESADTTAADCDFSKLSRVCGQMAQLLYYELNLPDSFVYIASNAISMFQAYGDTLSANTEKGPVSYLLAKRGEYTKAKAYLDSYESQSHLNKQTIERIENWKLLYYYKGVYYQGISECDSALFYYYKTLNTSKSPNNLSLACQGLYETYSMLHKSDSVAKYAVLYASKIDEGMKVSSTAALLSIQHLYDYHSYKSAAESKAIEAKRSRQRNVILALSLILTLIASAYVVYRLRKYIRLVKQRIRAKYFSDIHEYSVVKDALREAKGKNAFHEHLAIRAQSNLEDFKKDIENTQNKYSEEDCWGLSDVLQNSSIVKHLRYKAAKGEKPTDQELVEFRNKVSLFLPETLTTLFMKKTGISTKEKYICLFVFARFSPKEICVLMGTKSANLSNTRKRLYGKLFGSGGSAKEFDEKILGFSQISHL